MQVYKYIEFKNTGRQEYKGGAEQRMDLIRRPCILSDGIFL